MTAERDNRMLCHLDTEVVEVLRSVLRHVESADGLTHHVYADSHTERRPVTVTHRRVDQFVQDVRGEHQKHRVVDDPATNIPTGNAGHRNRTTNNLLTHLIPET